MRSATESLLKSNSVVRMALVSPTIVFRCNRFPCTANAAVSGARSASAPLRSSTPEYNDGAKPISHDSRLRSFEDLVGMAQHRLRNGQRERLGGLQVSHILLSSHDRSPFTTRGIPSAARGLP